MLKCKTVSKLMCLVLIFSLISCFCGCSSQKDTVPYEKSDDFAVSDAENDENGGKTEESGNISSENKEPNDTSSDIIDENDENNEIKGISYTFDYKSSDFTAENCGDSDKYILNGYDNAYVEVKFISGRHPEELAPSFLDDLIDYTSIEYCGDTDIGSSAENGELVIASDGEETISAYLLESANGTLAIMIRKPLDLSENASSMLDNLIDSLKVQYY